MLVIQNQVFYVIFPVIHMYKIWNIILSNNLTRSTVYINAIIVVKIKKKSFEEICSQNYKVFKKKSNALGNSME